MKQPIPILWTGGWDSTSRLLEILVVNKEAVRPIYVVDPERKSTGQEVSAMSRIRDRFTATYRDLAENFGTIELYHRREIKPDEQISEWYKQLSSTVHAGTQYEWLALFAKQHGFADIELGIQRRAQNLIGPMSKLIIPYLRGEGHECKMVGPFKEKFLRLFENFRFPIIYRTKSDLQELAEKNSFLTLMLLTWFCHRPAIDGKPCGYCRPCTLAKRGGIAHDFAKPTFWQLMKGRLIEKRRSAM